MSDALKKITSCSAIEAFEPELGQLLQPNRFFRHPGDVVRDPTLTVAEKRAVLASWASDACAVESIPTLRQMPGSNYVVRFDDVIDALQALDESATSEDRPGDRRFGAAGRDRNHDGARRRVLPTPAIGFESRAEGTS